MKCQSEAEEKERRKAMSKYNTLWEYVQKSGKESFQLTFEEMPEIFSALWLCWKVKEKRE